MIFGTWYNAIPSYYENETLRATFGPNHRHGNTLATHASFGDTISVLMQLDHSLPIVYTF